MIYFLWAFLFGVLGVSIVCQTFKTSYKHIFKFTGGIALLFIGFLCFSRIEIPQKYNYGSIVVDRLQKTTSYIYAKIQSYF